MTGFPPISFGLQVLVAQAKLGFDRTSPFHNLLHGVHLYGENRKTNIQLSETCPLTSKKQHSSS